MPLHLPPLSRRSFLRRSLAAGAGLLAIPAFRARAGADPDRWALLSDTHIAGDPATIMRGVNMADHLRSTLAELRGRSVKYAGVFVNGDCAVTKGLAEDYATFINLVAPAREAGLPIHLTLGNHDDRDVFWSALTETKSPAPPVAGKHISIVESARANWFLLDSLDVVNQTPGTLGAGQREWLAKALDERPAKPALVMVHHNPVPSSPGKNTGLTDTGELLAILAPRKHVKALVFGHSHTWRITAQDGLHLINLPAVAYPFGPKEATGWVDLTLRHQGASLELRAHDTALPAHGRVTELQWRG
ncbi:MAG: metallophosphoesterase [Chthoniobacteraceae bacterium]